MKQRRQESQQRDELLNWLLPEKLCEMQHRNIRGWGKRGWEKHVSFCSHALVGNGCPMDINTSHPRLAFGRVWGNPGHDPRIDL